MIVDKFYVSELLLLLCLFFVPLKAKKIKPKIEYPVKTDYIKNSLMRFYTYRVDMFSLDYVDTEYAAYKELKKRPIKGAINYLAAPWARLINLKELDQFPVLHIDGGFTICQHIKYRLMLPLLKKIGINVLFTPHATKNEFYDGIHVLPFPHRAVNGVSPQYKDVLYSFIGYNSHPVREKVLKMNAPEGCIIKERSCWHFSPNSLHPKELTKEEQALECLEYKDVLARSRYSLCPRGTGPSTLRFWESLQAGSIPILIADEMALPAEIDWQKCIIKVSESEVEKINDIIKNISTDQEEKMRAYCLNVFDKFSGKNFVSTIRHYYKNRV